MTTNFKFPATDAAVAKQTVAAIKSQEITEQSVVIVEEKAEAEEALLAAMPALEAARLALADLEKNDITEIRSFATPPEAVQVCMYIFTIYVYCIRNSDLITENKIIYYPSYLRKITKFKTLLSI